MIETIQKLNAYLETSSSTQDRIDIHELLNLLHLLEMPCEIEIETIQLLRSRFFSILERTINNNTPLASIANHALRALVDMTPTSRAGTDLMFSRTILGKGSFGQVRLCVWNNTPIALKQSQNRYVLRQEAEIHRCLRHPNIVSFLGSISEASIGLELMIAGSLSTVLYDRTIRLPWAMRLSIAHDIVSGLCYIHSQDVLHQDIKSPNILLDDNMRAKISDFGSAKRLRHATNSATLLWAAPEILDGRPCTIKTEVYSMGKVMLELTTRKTPFSNITHNNQINMAEIKAQIKAGQYERIPSDTPNMLRWLISHCCRLNAYDRPHTQEIAQELPRFMYR